MFDLKQKLWRLGGKAKPKDPNSEPVKQSQDSSHIDVRSCTWPWTWVYIIQNGDAKPCCYSSQAIGNLKDGLDVKQIWESEQAENLRQAVSENRVHTICAGASCSFVGGRVPISTVDEFRIYHDPIPTDLVEERHRRLAWLGRSQSLYVVAQAFLVTQEHEKAALWATRAVEHGDPHSGVILATVETAQGRTQLSKACMKALKQGAAASYGTACAQLAYQFFIRSKEVTFDRDQALQYLETARRKGDPFGFRLSALIELGFYDEEADVTPQNVRRAEQYARKAEKLGEADLEELFRQIAEANARVK